MSNRNRDYGLDWERFLVNHFKRYANSRRTPNSGALGTLLGDPSLQGDVSFSVDGLNFLIEAKAGYGGSQSITIKREWLDKVTKEATSQSPKRIPVVAAKMKDGKTDTAKLIIMSLETFTQLLDRIETAVDNLDEAYRFIYSLKDKVDITEFTGVK